jgi:hypothetical protein
MRRGLLLVLTVVAAGLAAGSPSEAVSAVTCSGPQSGTIVVFSTGSDRNQLNSHDQIAFEVMFTQPYSGLPVPGSLSFTISGPSGSRTVSPTQRLTAFQTLAAGSYSITAQWQIPCSDGTVVPESAPPKSFVVAQWKPWQATPVIGTTPRLRQVAPSVTAYAAATCAHGNHPGDYADERLSAEIFLTLNGSTPRSSSPHYVAVARHGCRTIVARHRAEKGARPTADVLVARQPGSIQLSEFNFPRGRVHILRMLLLLSTNGKVVAAARFRIVHKGRGLAVVRDSGPCPIRCRSG